MQFSQDGGQNGPSRITSNNVGESYRYRTGYGNRTTCFPRKRVMVGAQLLHSAQAQSKGSNSLKEKWRLNKKQRQGEKKSILTLVDVNFHDVV